MNFVGFRNCAYKLFINIFNIYVYIQGQNPKFKRAEILRKIKESEFPDTCVICTSIQCVLNTYTKFYEIPWSYIIMNSSTTRVSFCVDLVEQ